MNPSQEILNLAKQNNGIVTSAMVTSAGLFRGSLKYLSDQGYLVRVSRGVYTLPEVFEDEYVSLQSRYKRGIFSQETSLFLHNLTDRTPNRLCMTFPGTYNLSGPKREGVICHSCKDPYYRLGIEEVTTPGGNQVLAYSAERTLCDILKPRNQVSIEIMTDAFKQYVRRREKNIPQLSEYSKIFGCEQKVRTYLEVLL